MMYRHDFHINDSKLIYIKKLRGDYKYNERILYLSFDSTLSSKDLVHSPCFTEQSSKGHRKCNCQHVKANLKTMERKGGTLNIFSVVVVFFRI